MVEILCLSAEITVGLLIAAILWDRSAPKSDEESHFAEPTHSANTASLREACALFEQCLHLVNRTEQWEQDSPWFKGHRSLMVGANESLQSSLPAGQVDRLTGLRTPTFLHEKLEQNWTAGTPMPGCIASLDVDGLKAINDENGMDTGDLLIRQIGNALRDEVVFNAYPVRMEGGKFSILFPSLPLERSRLLLEQVRSKLSSQQYDVKNQPINVTFSASLIELEAIDSIDQVERLLHEGLFQAKAEGRNCSYYREHDSWNPIVPVSPPSTAIDEAVAPIDEKDSNPPAASPTEKASSDDIEALLAAARTNVKPAAKPKRQDEIGELISTMDSRPIEAPAEKPVQMEEKASSDDIEALFANMRSPKKEDAPKPVEKKPEPLSAEESASAASSSDIEALLASMRGGSSPTPLTKSNPIEPSVASAEVAAPKIAAEEAASIASSDDIEALFANMRSPKKEDAPKPVEKKPEPLSAEESASAASSSDIEALLTSMRGGSSPTPLTKSNPIEPSVASAEVAAPKSAAEEAASIASADDIEALLANMRGVPTTKPTSKKDEAAEILAEVREASKEVQEATEPVAKTNPMVASKPVLEEIDPTESASSDDIEALFASMKSK